MEKSGEILYPQNEEKLTGFPPDETPGEYNINTETILDAHSDIVSEQVIAMASKIGPIIKVIHEYSYINTRPLKYNTTFIFKYGTVKAVSGLSSGFEGSGPTAFINTLIALGFDEQKVKTLVIKRDPAGEGTIIFKIDPAGKEE